MADTLRATPELTRSQDGFIRKLNGTWHEKALWIYLAIVVLHWVEHLAQAYQIWILGMPRKESLGALGYVWPAIVKNETMHWTYAFLMIVGLFLLLPGFAGASRKWWMASLVIQTWHFIEHSALFIQASVGSNLFGSEVPISFVQVWFPRPELHLFYNAAVFLPMVVAMILHARHPSQSAIACSCAT